MKNNVVDVEMRQNESAKLGHPASGYPASEELACSLTKIGVGVDMSDKTREYPTKWELYKTNFYRRQISKTQYEFKYRVNQKDGVGQLVDTYKMRNDRNQPFRTFQEAKLHRKAFIDEIMARTPQSVNIPNLHTIAELWEDYERNRGDDLRPNTLAKHQGNVKNYLIPQFKKRYIEYITLGEAKNYISFLLNKKKKAPETVKSVLATMSKIWSYARELHIIPRETYMEMFVDKATKITVDTKKDKTVVSFTEEQLEKIFEYAKEESETYYVLLCLTYFGGVRLSEALGIRWQDIDWSENKITIQQQLCYDKSGKRHTRNRTYIGPPKENKDRPFYAAPKLLEVLQAWKEEQEQNKAKYGRKYNDKEVLDDDKNGGTVKGGDYVLRLEDGSIVTHSNANHFRERLQKKVLKDADFHGMRRTIVTKLISDGVTLTAVSNFIGHADTRTTELFYVDKKNVDDSQLVSVMQKIS